MALLCVNCFCGRTGSGLGKNSGEEGLFLDPASCLVCEKMCGVEPIFFEYAYGGKVLEITP